MFAPVDGGNTRSRALEHVRICDFTGQLAGAGATRFLAAIGAQVIRIEDPTREGRWDIVRGGSPYVDERRGNELGGAFNNHNVEKLGITLNLRTERGRELLRELVAVSDVVTENFAAGVMARLGFALRRLARDPARHHLRLQLRVRRRPARIPRSRRGARSCRPCCGLTLQRPGSPACPGPVGATPTWTTMAATSWRSPSSRR